MRPPILARLALLVAALLLLALPSPAGAALQTYDLPTGVNAGEAIAADGSGGVWFGAGDLFSQQPRIGHFDPAQATGADAGYALYPTPTFVGAPCCATQVRSLAYDATAQRLWLGRSDGLYGYLDTPAAVAGSATTGWTTSHLPSMGEVRGLALDQNGARAWFAEYSSSNVETPSGSHYYPGGRIASTGIALAVTELPNLAQQNGEATLVSSRYDAKPQGLSSDGAGGVWFAESNPGLPGYRLGHTSGGAYAEYDITPCLGALPLCSGTNTGTGPTSTTVGKDGMVWFTNQVNNTFGRLDTSAGQMTSYALTSISGSLAGGVPRALTTAPDGTIWLAVYGGYSAPSANAVVKIVPGATPTATVFPTPGVFPLALSVSAKTGDVWVALNAPSTPGKLGRISGEVVVPAEGPGGGAPGPSPTPTPSSPAASAAPTPTPTVLHPQSVAPLQLSTTRVTDDTISLNQRCVGPPTDPCALVYLIDTAEYVVGFPGTRRSLALGRRAGPKARVVLGQATATLYGGESKKVKVRLGKKARKALAKQSISARLVVQQQQADGSYKTLGTKKVRFKRAR